MKEYASMLATSIVQPYKNLKNPDATDVLMEGGAEYLERHVLREKLSNNRQFDINWSTYAEEFKALNKNFLFGGLGTFSLAYFQGRVDVIGLKLPTSQQSSSVTQGKTVITPRRSQ
jgi:hypothetical protein